VCLHSKYARTSSALEIRHITCNRVQDILWWGLCFILYVLGKTVLLSRVISSNSSSILPVLHIQYSSHKHRLWSHQGQSRVRFNCFVAFNDASVLLFWGNIIEHYPVLVKLVYPRRGMPRPRPRRARWAAPGGIPRCWPGWADSSFSVDRKIWVSHDVEDRK
jgi:hypothetical protein